MDIIRFILVLISGVCWSAVYIDSTRIGFKEKTYAMPLFALALNISWEGIYAFTDLFIRHDIGIQAIANSCWFFLDILIVITYFLYGRKEARTQTERLFFIPWSILVFICCFVLQMLFFKEFGDVEGEKYSAFLQNIVMSIAYLSMLNARRKGEGQSLIIAISKCIGTLTPTILGTLEGNYFILVTGIFCFIFDVIYIYALYSAKYKKEGF